MPSEIPIANPPLSIEEKVVVVGLSDADLQVVDATILDCTYCGWSKVAAVVIKVERALSNHYPGLSYIFYAQRLIWLAEQGQLESQGNLEYMRFSEVRLPNTDASPTAGEKDI